MEGVTTVEQLKEKKAEELKAEKERKARSEYFGKLLDKIAEGSKVAIPTEIIDNQVEGSKKEIVNRMAQSGLTLEQYLQIVGQTEEQFVAKIREDAEKDARNYFIMDAISAKENLGIDELKQRIFKFFEKDFIFCELFVPYAEISTYSKHKDLIIERKSRYENEGLFIDAIVPTTQLIKFEKYIIGKK